MTDLAIAEVFYESGALRYRYARYQAPDGSRWIRHGLFVAYHENGAVASEGGYEHGVEHVRLHHVHQDLVRVSP